MRRDENRNEPVLVVFNRARGHDARNRTGVGAEHRDERFPIEAHATHQAIHDERSPRHVAGAFQETDKEKQN